MSSDGEKLIEAAAHRDVTFAADLLAKRANLNYRNEDNETALYKASEKGNLEVVKLLLFHKAKIETKTCDGKTALSIASANGHLEVVMELLKCGASVDNTDRNGMTPLHAVTSTRQLNIALERREPINSEDKDEIRASYLNVAKELMKFGAKINTKDIDGRTPLHWASKNGYLDFVVELLDNGASVFVRDKDGRAPLNEASVMGHSNIVQVLLKHNAPVNNRSWDGSTALFDALWQGYLDIARQLLAHDASVYVEDLHGITCLHVASISSKGNVDIVKELVTRRAKIDAVDKHGNTPLHCATFWGHYKIVKELITPPALVDKTNKIGCTPLHLALKRGHFDILRLLLDAGANVEIKNEDGQTPPELGNNKVKNIFENHASFSGVLSNQSASELIRQTRVNRKRTSSTVLETAYSVLDLSLVVQSQRQNVLTIGLLVKAIVENVMVQGFQGQEQVLLSVLTEIRNYLRTKSLTSNFWKLKFDHDTIKGTSITLLYFQTRLVDVAKNLSLPLNCRVRGNLGDIRNDIRNAIEKIYDIDRYLIVCMREPDLQRQMDSLTELAISIQRTLEYYNRQVACGNILREFEFENQLRFCQDKIANTIDELYQSKGIFKSLPQIESWILSFDDVRFDFATPLGRGGSATVFKGKYQGQVVAVKCFDRISADSSDLENIIQSEIICWEAISHEPYILTFIGACTKVSRPIIVMELCDNNIRRFVRDWPEMLLPMVYQFACGLASIHNANVIHGDLKGDNVLVTFQKTVAVADFGLSRTVTSLETSKTGDKRVGTLNWMSPEQYFTPRNVTTKSDIWSFGMTVWEVLCNDIPYRGCSENDFADYIFQVEDDRPEKPYDLGQQLEPLWILITRCWRLDPAARPTASEIVDFLQTHSGDQLTSQEDSSPLPCIEDLEQFQLFNVESNEFVVPEETIKSVTSLEELVKLLLANPATSWPLFRNFILYPDEIKSSNHPTFRAANDRQPQKLLVVKLSYERSDLDSIESCLDDETRCHLVLECVDWGEWNVAGYKCYAIIMERDTKNMSLFSPNRQTQPTALSTQSANCFPPCLWKLQGATTYPLPRGKLSHKMSLRLLFCCEVRDNSSCDYFPHDDVIQVEAQSTFIRDALPTLKMSFLLLKAFALISDYNICIGPDYNFDVRDSAPEEILLTALEAIHGQVDTLQRLNKIVQELESGDLNDDQVENYANEIYGIIDDHRERNASEMLNLLQNAGLNLQSDVISGLKKHALISRYVCKKHSELFEDGVLNLRRDPPLHLDTSSVLSLSLAAKYILKTLENMVESTSEIIVTARGIFDLALKCEVHRQSVLVTALMVERIVRKVQTLEGLEHPQTLLSSI
ncbi:hypothetical protein AeRB84_008070 [Aphanomyces euteiches]|nr:hypothetical protein AeRB84_008070 [Aphanomyces euteiches]